jgi:hypothetical protein
VEDSQVLLPGYHKAQQTQQVGTHALEQILPQSQTHIRALHVIKMIMNVLWNAMIMQTCIKDNKLSFLSTIFFHDIVSRQQNQLVLILFKVTTNHF